MTVPLKRARYKKLDNSKLKEKYCINEKTHLVTEKNLYFIIL